MIAVKSLGKCYGVKKALKGVSFEVKAGEIFGFLGANGAGKTTTIRILTGQLLPTNGEARIMDRDVIRDRLYIQKKMGVVPEKTNLYERLTVGQNLEFFCRLYESESKNIDSYLEQVKMFKEKNTQVKKLSKGMKQRILLVRALLANPRVLFLDEPTSGLDPNSANQIHQILQGLNAEGMTILLTSHNMEEVDKLCHRVAFLDRGSIVAAGDPEELKLKFTNRTMRVLIEGSEGLREEYLDMTGEESSVKIAGWIREGKVKSIHSCEPTLADIFMKVTGRELV